MNDVQNTERSLHVIYIIGDDTPNLACNKNFITFTDFTNQLAVLVNQKNTVWVVGQGLNESERNILRKVQNVYPDISLLQPSRLTPIHVDCKDLILDNLEQIDHNTFITYVTIETSTASNIILHEAAQGMLSYIAAHHRRFKNEAQCTIIKSDHLRIHHELYPVQLNLQTEILNQTTNRFGITITLRHRFYQASILCAEVNVIADVIPKKIYADVQQQHAEKIIHKIKKAIS